MASFSRTLQNTQLGGATALYAYFGGDYPYNTYRTMDNFTISASAVPEPSTYAALAGLTALGVAEWRRKRERRT